MYQACGVGMVFTTGNMELTGQGRSTSVDLALVDSFMELVIRQRILIVESAKPNIVGRVTSITLTPDAAGEDLLVVNVEFLPE